MCIRDRIKDIDNSANKDIVVVAQKDGNVESPLDDDLYKIGTLATVMKIFDMPDSSYRGLMIDLSRMWHSLESIRSVIDLASFYKIKYLQLHLSDDQAFAFPTDSFPNLPTPDRPYSKKDFIELLLCYS